MLRGILAAVALVTLAVLAGCTDAAVETDLQNPEEAAHRLKGAGLASSAGMSCSPEHPAPPWMAPCLETRLQLSSFECDPPQVLSLVVETPAALGMDPASFGQAAASLLAGGNGSYVECEYELTWSIVGRSTSPGGQVRISFSHDGSATEAECAVPANGDCRQEGLARGRMVFHGPGEDTGTRARLDATLDGLLLESSGFQSLEFDVWS